MTSPYPTFSATDPSIVPRCWLSIRRSLDSEAARICFKPTRMTALSRADKKREYHIVNL